MQLGLQKNAWHACSSVLTQIFVAFPEYLAVAEYLGTFEYAFL